MLDQSIPYYNIIMKCPKNIEVHSVSLPAGYSLRFFEPGDEESWAAIEASVGEFASQGEALAYFYEHYMSQKDELAQRCLFAVDPHGMPVGTCTAWRDPKGGQTVNSLHWLAVCPQYQGRGLGKALVSKVMDVYRGMDGPAPVYLHTQTWSHRAVGLYLKSGFRALKSEAFSYYKNDYEQASAVLSCVMQADLYRLFISTAV